MQLPATLQIQQSWQGKGTQSMVGRFLDSLFVVTQILGSLAKTGFKPL